eukprot:9277284-Pyramimonas_sp.AAC.1
MDTMDVCQTPSRLEALKGVALRLRETGKELQEALDECSEIRECTEMCILGRIMYRVAGATTEEDVKT